VQLEKKEYYSAVISAKVTPEEREKIKAIAEAKGLTISEFVRKKLLDIEIPERISPERLAKKNEIFRKYLAEVNKIGSNINQIARYCNKHREVDAIVLERLIEIEESLKGLLNCLYGEIADANRQAGGENQT
jgi:ferritin